MREPSLHNLHKSTRVNLQTQHDLFHFDPNVTANPILDNGDNDNRFTSQFLFLFLLVKRFTSQASVAR